MVFRRRTVALLALFALLFSLCVAQTKAQQQRGPSTAEERAHAVQIAKALRADPLSADSKKNREWILLWLIQVPDITVSVCSDLLGDTGKSKKNDNGPALLAVLMASEAAFIIENPDKAKDANAVHFAGADGVLDAYQAIRAKDANYHAKQLDELLQLRTDGKLADRIATIVSTKCSK